MGEASGPDHVPLEMLKFGGPHCTDLLSEMAKCAGKRGFPSCCKGGQMVLVPKR